jgi:hypothetical protein
MNTVEMAYAIGAEAAFINFDKLHSMMGHLHNAVLTETANAN